MRTDPTVLAKALCDLFGLDPRATRAITIEVEANHLPLVTVEQFVLDDEGLVTVLRSFDLHEHTDAPPALEETS